MESFFTGSVKSYRLISPAQLAHPGHGSTSAPDQLCDGRPESELYQQSIENIGKTAALSHLGTQQQTLEHEDEEDDTSTTSLWSGARNISTSHIFTPITFCNCKLVCCKYKWKNINGTLNLLLQFLKITFSQFPGPRLLAAAWCWWCVTPRPVFMLSCLKTWDMTMLTTLTRGTHAYTVTGFLPTVTHRASPTV